MRYFFILLSLIICCEIHSQDFKSFLEDVSKTPLILRQAKTDSFLLRHKISPVIESDSLCTFFWTGSAERIAVIGDLTGWHPGLTNMTNLPGTNLWYFTCSFEPDARLDYKFVIDGKTWILDPRNPDICIGGYGPNSEFHMPAYKYPPGIKYYSDIPHGSFMDTIIHSKYLSDDRKIRIYLPPVYSAGKIEYPVMVFHDGLDYITFGQANNIIDYLIFHQEILPIIGIFIPPHDRDGEYAGEKMKEFASFIIDELMPVMEKKYGISKDPDKRATSGVSQGGNIALYLGMKYPGSFGKIAVQSSNIQSEIFKLFKQGKMRDPDIYIDIGKYDIEALIKLNKDFISVLRSGEYHYQFYEINEGHSWGNWKGHLAVVLKQFFPY